MTDELTRRAWIAGVAGGLSMATAEAEQPQRQPKATFGFCLNTSTVRYRALLDLGMSMGITPIVEVWGFSKTLRRLGEALLLAVECGSPAGCVLPDVYHLYKGGSDFAGLKLLAPSAIGIFHVNDYPK